MGFFKRNPPQPRPVDVQLSKSQLQRATRTRSVFTIVTSLFLFLAVLFLIIVEIGNVKDQTVLRSVYFIKLDLSNVIPDSVPNGIIISSIARTIGLYDFYQVGLWNYCEGYNNEGIQECSSPSTRFWFNPVGLLVNQLIAGAKITLPDEIKQILDIIRIASHWMFGLFMTGACLSTVLVIVVYLSNSSRWWSFFTTIFTLINALCITAASIIATVMFIVMRNVFVNNMADINIGAEIGTAMFACMWIAAGFSIFAFLIQLGQMCCCASRRDVRRGKKRGSRAAYSDVNSDKELQKEPERKRRFWQRGSSSS